MKKQNLDKKFWQTTRGEINNSYDFSNIWQEVIIRFENRINNYYLIPISKLIDSRILKGEGFTILTIQCALIEMLASFKYGKIHNHIKKGTDPRFEYKYASECLYPFLYSEPIFENHFFYFDAQNGKIENQPFCARDFYENVRCGLMHEARTKGEWLVNAKINYLGSEKIFITRNNSTGEISIDRNILNTQLKLYFKNYIDSLRENSNEGNSLRRLFARKLDHLHDISSDPLNYEWWIDQ